MLNQNDLNRAVARATGESVSTIAGMGFVELPETHGGHDTDDVALDWDEIEHERRLTAFPYRKPRAAVA